MRIHKLLAATAVAALPLIAAARPASPELMRHVNPDGTTVEFYLHGNEHFNYMTDADGVGILEFKNGILAPAMRGGVRLTAVEADLNVLRAERPQYEMPATKQGSRMAALETSGDNRGRTTFPTIGEVRSCVILLEYPDRPFSVADPVAQYTRLCNESGYSDFGSRGSAKDYYEASSNGKFKPQFDVYGPVKLKHNAAYYTGQDDPILADKGTNERFGVAIQEAIEFLDDTVDFSIYDYDNNGEIDNVFFFFSGAGQADSGDSTCIWPHQSDYRRYTAYTGNPLNLPYLFPDGVQLTCYACSCELNSSRKIPDSEKPHLDGIGAFCHEFGHVLGLPDLYDVNGSGCKTPGKYSIMDQGSYNELSTCPPVFSAYEQWVCKWLDYTDAQDGESYSLNPLTSKDRNAVRLRIRQPGGVVSYYPEYYVLESRGESDWDSSLPEHGMMIWRINFNNNTWQSNNVNTGYSPNVEMIGPDSRSFGWPGDFEDYTYITPSMKVLTPVCLRKAMDVTITNISYDWDSGVTSFEYNKYAPSEDAPLLKDNVTADQSKREFYLEWTAVPDVEYYTLTVKRTDDASGNTYTVDGLDETNVGLATSHTVRNLTLNQWKQKIRAYVRVFNGVPGAVTSNVLEFVPAELPAGTGVDEVSVSVAPIYGGKCRIEAPASARVFTVGGVECGRENLPAGVYIVVAEGQTAKVTVR